MEQVRLKVFVLKRGSKNAFVVSYEYEIEVRIASPKGLLNLNSRSESKIYIKAEHSFGNFTQRINTSDKIWFKGVLKTSLGSRNAADFVLQNLQDSNNSKKKKYTKIELTAIGCLHCADKNLAPMTIKSYLKMNRLKDLRRGLKYFLNVIFNPILTFK